MDNVPSDLQRYRVTCSLMAILIVVFWWAPVSPTQAVIVDNSLFQTLINNFVHLHRFHICMNLMTLFNLRYIEDKLGHYRYASLLTILMVLKTFLYSFCLGDHYQASFGFSGVIFGLVTIYPSQNIMGIAIDQRFYSVALLFLMQLVPNSSFYGHLAGILAGFVFMEVFKGYVDNSSSTITGGVLRQRQSRLAE